MELYKVLLESQGAGTPGGTTREVERGYDVVDVVTQILQVVERAEA
jgi:hypothetical protein